MGHHTPGYYSRGAGTRHGSGGGTAPCGGAIIARSLRIAVALMHRFADKQTQCPTEGGARGLVHTQMKTRRLKKWGCIALVALGMYAVGNLYQPTVVVGSSMAPTLKDGRVIAVDRTYYKTNQPKRGEVVVFSLDGVTYVKRVYRGPGEVVHYIGDDNSWMGTVRESRVAELRRSYAGSRSRFKVKSMVVPEDSVFVLGDNYHSSEDSRELGPIAISDLVGRARLEVDRTTSLSFEIAPRRRSRGSAEAPAVAANRERTPAVSAIGQRSPAAPRPWFHWPNPARAGSPRERHVTRTGA